MPASRLPELIARRGNVADYPENTLPALRSALELGARHLGFDVQLSVDRHPILLNDSNLQRIAGVDRNALEMTWSELTDIAVTEPQRFAERYTDIGIPRLGQAVEVLASQPATTAFVELKRASLRAFGHEAVVRKVCEVLKPVARQCVLISADFAAVHHVRQVSAYRVGWRLAEYTNTAALKCEALAPDYLFCDHQVLTESASKLWRGPWRWVVYDVRTPKLALEVAARGARLVETSSIREMMRERRKESG
ncbi:MAG TPA: glycerophosphodiester phosphodiesterase family protein [Steroidobacteraceae bacterium]|nr:glycerophosphodiester phosphodiesterase family protein [Steroidobacteraceae bacterium]